MTWTEAKSFCETQSVEPFSSHLVEIGSADENNAIIKVIEEKKYQSQKIEFWMGLTDRRSETNWVLETIEQKSWFTSWQKPHGFLNLFTGRPNGRGDCAHFNQWNNWADQDCDLRQEGGYTWNALCEIRYS